MKVDYLEGKHTILENYTKVLEQKVISLQHLKGVSDLQTVLSVCNETTLLREKLKRTNNSLNSVLNEDFIALLNKANSTEHNLELTAKALYK